MRLPSKIFVATQPTNMHLSFDRLAGLVRDHLGGDPRSDAVFVFHNKRGTHVKLLWHDGVGYRVLYARLDRGRYRIPMSSPADSSTVQITARELDVLLEGIDMAIVRAAQRSVRRAV